MKKAAWIVGVVLFALVSLAILKFAPEIGAVEATAFPLPKPMATAKFADGSEFQILQMAEQKLVDGITKAPKARFLKEPIWSVGGNSVMNFTYAWYKSDSELRGVSFASHYPYLLLETRRLLKNGTAIPIVRTHADGRVRDAGLRSNAYTFAGSAAMVDGKADARGFPDVLIQLADGQGGWITGNGPYTIGEDPQCRSAVCFKAWPRSLATLTFRITIPGQESVEVSLPNLPPKPRSTWPVVPVPASQEFPEFSVQLERVTRCAVPEQLPMITVNQRFTSKLPPIHGEEQWDLLSGTLEDDTGNLVIQEPILYAPGNSFGFPYTTDAKQFRLRYQVKASRAYAVPLSRATILVEGKISDDGKSFIPDAPYVRQLAVDQVELNVGSGSGSKSSLELKLNGNFSLSEESMVQSVHDGTNGWHPVLFLDDEAHSSGLAELNSSSSGRTGKGGDFKRCGDWEGTLKPGQRVRFGLVPPIPETEVVFTFDRSQIKE